MFGSTAQEVTKTKGSLPALQNLPSHQEAPEAQVKATKKPVCWSTIEKIKTGNKKNTRNQWHRRYLHTTRRQRKHKPNPRTTGSYETRNQELKMEENIRAQIKTLHWKRKQQKNLGKDVKVVDVRKILEQNYLTAPQRALVKGGIAKKEPDRTSWHPQCNSCRIPWQSRACYFGGDFGWACFWPIQDIFVVAEPLFCVGTSSWPLVTLLRAI